ncbi:hypothetical protein [Kineosporia sp. NBRC 101731]|uniref:hypothetical protein n=1 Tax=Kineosporia sp. NBRC 101731 TaxID=3032199 RepID=UPI0024A4521A|nr:hypothetical protein [Kineosporia sp. NBRC 101731]GLY33675.1 hypothetical protein Kisp02_70400 [Kineosporia sp. NBRC 101731]
MSDPDAAGSAILDPIWATAHLEARRAGVPSTMVDAATEHRLAGDWRRACAAAAVDVRLDLADIRKRHGPDVHRQILADLRCFAPDLLRWHLPRSLPGGGPQKGLVLILAEYPGAGALVVRTPGVHWAAGERLVLELAEPPPVGRRADRWRIVHHRYLWDADRSGEYASLTVDSDSVVQAQDAGDFAGAWRLAGIDLHPGEGSRMLRHLRVNLPRLLGLRETVALRPGAGLAIVLQPRRKGPYASGVDAYVTSAMAAARLPVLPRPAWCRPLDHDLVRLGLATPMQLHPLVRQAFRGDPVAAGDSVQIDCRGRAHRVRRENGRWTALDHDDRQDEAERFLIGLGAVVLGCHQVIAELEHAHVVEKERFAAVPRYRSALAGVLTWPAPDGLSLQGSGTFRASPVARETEAGRTPRGRHNTKPLTGRYLPKLRKGACCEPSDDEW